jgi:hypothetical protein
VAGLDSPRAPGGSPAGPSPSGCRFTTGSAERSTFYAGNPNAFDDAIALARSFASYAGLAMTNAYLEDAKRTLSRDEGGGAVIEQAKGVIMDERRCTVEEAFSILTAMARDGGDAVRDVAQAPGGPYG